MRAPDRPEALLAAAPRVGIGYDVHRFAEGRPLVLGGVEIPSPMGLQGHSDADAATHAVIDAMLGAAALGDIGEFFPDSDPAWRGISSLELLRICRGKVEARGYLISSVDVTIVAEQPRLAPHKARMRETLARALDLPVERIGMKATTHERLGTLGRGEGLAAMACVTLIPVPGESAP